MEAEKEERSFGKMSTWKLSLINQTSGGEYKSIGKEIHLSHAVAEYREAWRERSRVVDGSGFRWEHCVITRGKFPGQ